MRQIALILFLHLYIVAYSQEQTMGTLPKEQEKNVQLLPKYGGVEKTQEQKEADQKFIELVLTQEKYRGNKKLASDDLIKTGFNFLYKNDLKTAMYRFNQAYLIDSTNTDIYWGYGGVYMMQSHFEKAKEQYEIGLNQNSQNTHLLIDLATYYLTKYQKPENNSINRDKKYLTKALELLNHSYSIDNKDQNTLFKLSLCHLLNNDCKNARRFYNECKAEGGQPITQGYTEYLERNCKE